MELSNPQHEAFAQHVAEGLSLTEAALRTGYAPTSAPNYASRLAKTRNVSNRIAELRSLRAVSTGATGIRNPQARVAALEDRWERMRRIITERANAYEDQDEPGVKTGLLIKQERRIGSGDKAMVTTSYVLDTDILTLLCAHEKQAAEELGQWTKRTESYRESVSVSLMDRAQLNETLKQHLGNASAADRRAVLDAVPELVALAQPGEPVADSPHGE